MGFFNLSDAMTLGLVEGAQDTLSSIRKKDEEDYKLAKKQAENASIVAGKVTAKYKEQEKAYEVTGQNLLNNVAFQKSIDKLKTKYPNLILEAKTKDDQTNSHMSIEHKQNNHTIWLFIYDKSGIHEQESEGKIEKTKSDRVKKYTGTMPTESEIKKMI